ncbi:MAG: RDD family protein [Phycisphaerae bacterium]|nr:RDD family protein [Phycisphaerales bacterium]
MMAKSNGGQQISRQTQLALMCIAVLCSAAGVIAEERVTPLGVIGNDEYVWIYRTTKTTGAETGSVKFAAGQSTDSGLRFRVFRGEPFGGTIEACALRGENLHVFYGDGSHYRLRLAERVMSETTQDDDVPEKTTPGGSAPKAVCGDAESDSVYAIVPTDTALSLPLHIQPEVVASENASVTENITSNGSATNAQKPEPVKAESVVDRSVPQPKFSLVRYHRGEWQFVALCPSSLDVAANVWMATSKGEFAILYATVGESNQLMIVKGSETEWQTPSAGPKLPTSSVLSFFSEQRVFTVLACEKTEATSAPDVKSYRWLDGIWKPGAKFDINVDESFEFGNEIAAGMFGKYAVLAYESKSQETSRFWAGVWEMAGGSPTVEPTELLPLGPNLPSAKRTEMASIAIAIILSLLLFIVFVRRTPSLFVEMELPEGYALAGAGKRTLAFVIDLIAFSLVAFPLIVTPWMTSHLTPGEDIQREFTYLLEFNPDVTFEPWTKCLLLFVVYATAMELACRATIGKLVLGLRVASTSGKRGTALSIIVRNCLRFELYYKLAFLPLAMLVILTRNHQRLGDLVAGTLVIEPIKQPAQS